MKGIKMVSLDTEILELLSGEKNCSKLINDLLHTHYGSSRESLNRRKASIAKETAIIEAEEKELLVIENENAMHAKMRSVKDAKANENKANYENAYKKLKDKKLPFDVFRNAAVELRKKWGVRA